MARPELKSKTAGSKTSPGKPFKAWWDGRKERKKQLEEEAARAILNETAGKENAIIRELEQVDFDNSRLPKSVLEEKTRPDQRYCDLEMGTRHLIYELRNNTQPVKADVRRIDEQLWKLAKLLRQAVEQGDPEAAKAAKAGLAYGIMRIRFCIPDSQPEFLKDFVNLNVKYLEEWITLVNMSQVIDKNNENLQLMKARVTADRAEAEKERDDLEKKLNTDAAFREAFVHIRDFDGTEDRQKWSPLQRQIHQTMVRGVLKRTIANLNEALLSQKETLQDVKRQNRRMLFNKLSDVPVFEDPNMMNKYKESVDALFDEMAKADAEIEESLKRFDEIDGRIKQLDYMPGALKANEMAAERAQEYLNEIREQQQREIAGTGGGISLRELGILSTEEVEAEKEQVLQEAAEQEQQVERQTERQRLYES
ncbi:MAG: hypothetical protein IKH34_06850 [Oscillospiraceae bacterium]|nr:hypothetical protein [Oscillospiraceae bacterium]